MIPFTLLALSLLAANVDSTAEVPRPAVETMVASGAEDARGSNPAVALPDGPPALPSDPPALQADVAPPLTEVPEAALAPRPPPWRKGRTALQLAAATPAHLAASVLVLGAACSGELVQVECGKTLEGKGGALALTGAALALLPPLASGAIVYGLEEGDGFSPSFFWTVGAGAAAQALGFGLALATGEPAVGILSLTLLPVVSEMLAARLTLAPDGTRVSSIAMQAPQQPPQPLPLARAPLPVASGSLIVPLAGARF